LKFNDFSGYWMDFFKITRKNLWMIFGSESSINKRPKRAVTKRNPEKKRQINHRIFQTFSWLLNLLNFHKKLQIRKTKRIKT
jgi:hypothetical protein